MDEKGQASVEYLLITLVFLIIIGSVSLPFIGQTLNDTTDVSHSSDASAAINSIANAVGIVAANGPGSARYITVYFSDSGTLRYNAANKTIEMPLTLNNGSKVIDASVPNPVSFSGTTTVSQASYNANITWTSGNTINVALIQSS
jgi:uncharacterized protein (UPF0333 family)